MAPRTKAAGRRVSGKRSSVPARDLAYQHIRAQIHARVLAPGQPLSELSLAKELGSSRTPIREAIGLLVAEGVLETTHNRGAVVRRLTRSDIVDLCEVREAMEIFTAEKMAGKGLLPEQTRLLRATIEGIRELRGAMTPEQRVLDDTSMARFIQLDRRFHEQIVLLTMNRAMQDILRKAGVLVQVFAMPRRGHDAALLQRVIEEHERILAAFEACNAGEARRLLAQHLQSSMRQRLEEFDTWERNQMMSIATESQVEAPFIVFP